jgi:hypothetical protein
MDDGSTTGLRSVLCLRERAAMADAGPLKNGRSSVVDIRLGFGAACFQKEVWIDGIRKKESIITIID